MANDSPLIKPMIALDLGTCTGWAMKAGNYPIASGVESFKPARFEGGGMRFVRFTRFLDALRPDIGAIYFEEVRRHIGVDAAHIYGGFLAHLSAYCESKSIPYAGVPVGTIKKSFTGSGAARKVDMIAEARKRGHQPADDNEADAIALLYYVLSLDQ